jgi:hypothetical protein
MHFIDASLQYTLEKQTCSKLNHIGSIQLITNTTSLGDWTLNTAETLLHRDVIAFRFLFLFSSRNVNCENLTDDDINFDLWADPE